MALKDALNYMHEDEALAQGFTHHGAMYGIPCWVGDPDSEGPMVAAKWAPLEHLISLGHWFMGLRCDMTGAEPSFCIHIGPPIVAG